MSGNLPAWLTILKAQLVADKKRAVILGTLFLVLVGVMVKTFVLDDQPAEATAAPAVASAEAPKERIVPMVRPSPQTVKATSALSRAAKDSGRRSNILRRRAQSARSGSERTVAVDDIPLVLARDLFNTDSWSQFGRTTSSLSLTGRKGSQPAEPFWSSLATAIGAHQQSRRLEAERILDELAELELQSTMTGTTPLAYISGRLVRQGDEIRGFSVIHIEERRVLLRSRGADYELAMP